MHKEVLNMSFGRRLKELRTEKRESQKNVARKIGISVNAISQYESNARFPNEEILKRLCEYYNISSDYLLGLTDVKHSPLTKEEAKQKMMTPKQMDFICDLIETINLKEDSD